MSKVIIDKDGPVKTILDEPPEKRTALDSELLQTDDSKALRAPSRPKTGVDDPRQGAGRVLRRLEMAERSETIATGSASGIEVMLSAIELCPLPVVAVVHGDAMPAATSWRCMRPGGGQPTRRRSHVAAQVGLAPNWFLAKEAHECWGRDDARDAAAGRPLLGPSSSRFG